MASGRRAKKQDDGFTTRTVMAMATEMAETRASFERACLQFGALAASLGVAIPWQDPIV